jgi:hypothetical protein
MTQKFERMIRSELKAYVRQHPSDSQTIRELFVNRRNPNARQYPHPYSMPADEVEAILEKN